VIERKKYLDSIAARIEHNPVVALLGPRQVGKTTLAKQFTESRQARYFDLESAATQDVLRQPAAVLEPLTGLVVIDEVQRMPELFPLLRVWSDRRPLPARFLVLGSVSPWLMKGVTESLAGRVSFVDVTGLSLAEVGVDNHRRLWWRGGFPVAYLVETDELARQWQEDLERTVIERDLALFGVSESPAVMRRFWAMVAHYHGQTWNSSEIGRSLGVTEKTARRYLDALAATFLVRQLPPWFENLAKRQIKAPKVYIRDSGLLHGLLHLASPQRLEEHPKLGASWEGFALEQVLRITGDRDAYFWATHSGAEVDLMVLWLGQRIGFEFKFSDAPGITKSMHIALADLKLDRLFVVVPGKDSYALGPKVEVLSILNLPERLGQMQEEKKK
jgi:predicted AAA+ superfamily ATPase